ncbi:MAG: hypothetical protein WCH40_07565 [Verrucomicrobiales bacterium]
MAKKEVELSRRRIGSALVTTLAVVGLLVAYVKFSPLVPRHAYLSGWVLFGAMLFLTFFNLRKKVPFLRLGSTSFWLQLHLYVGIFSGALFAVHIGWSWPAGIFHQLLAWCYVVVFVTGVLGLWISRAFPRMLTVAGYETPFERIPFARRNLRDQAEALVLAGVDGQTSPVIAEFYLKKLGMFFAKPCNRLAHLKQSRSPQADHLAQFDEVQRYVRTGEREMLDKLQDLVAQKHMLDYQYSLQSTLRLWLFAHIPLSYSLLIFSVLHVILVHAYSGSVS